MGTKEKLYRIRYDDNDLEHLTRDQVLEFKVVVKAKGRPKAKAGTEAVASTHVQDEKKEKDMPVQKKPSAVTPQEEEQDEAEEVSMPIKKKPASASSQAASVSKPLPVQKDITKSRPSDAGKKSVSGKAVLK